MPKVSVVVPVYGVEKYIERCVRSLFQQTIDSIEYIFVDDCSPDNSLDIIKKVLEEFPQRKTQVKIICHEFNQRVGAVRNHGVAACTGDYIIHCDSDDWIDLNLYETMYNKAIETGADVVCCPLLIPPYWKCKKPQIISPVVADSGKEYTEKNIGGHLNHLFTKLYKKEIALDNSLDIPDHIFLCEDLLRNVLMLDKCQKAAFVDNVYYYYQQIDNSVSHNFSTRHFENLEDILAILNKLSADKFSSVCLCLKAYILLNALFFLNKIPELKYYFNKWCPLISFKDKLKILFCRKYTFRGRCALAVGFIYPELIFWLMTLIKI